jgi:hypothetical protein
MNLITHLFSHKRLEVVEMDGPFRLQLLRREWFLEETLAIHLKEAAQLIFRATYYLEHLERQESKVRNKSLRVPLQRLPF